jgi:hypothetical protein
VKIGVVGLMIVLPGLKIGKRVEVGCEVRAFDKLWMTWILSRMK